MERQLRAQQHQAGEVRPREPAAGARPLSHVARAGARLRRQRAASPIAPATACEVDRQSSVYAAGEIAHLSYDAQLTHQPARACPSRCGCAPIRSDPDGELLGPLNATHFGVRRRRGLRQRLTGSSACGRGAVITNRPLTAQTAFDRTRFEGDLPPGWEAEIYRNGELLGFAKPTSDQRYVFDDVQLLYGENRMRDRPLRAAGADPDARGADQRRPGQCPARQDLVLGRLQPARPRPLHAARSLRTAAICPRPRRPSRSSMASTSARRSARSRA